MVNDNPDYYLGIIQEQLINGTFKTSKYTRFTKKENGKERVIYKLPYFPDRIVQWAILQVIEPYLLNRMTKDTYSAIPKRGAHKILKSLKPALHNDIKETKYCMKLDIKHYYQNIDHELLKQTYRFIFKDKRLLNLLDEIIDSISTSDNNIEGVGIPIGNYLSQYSGNIFLSDIDHWIKEEKKIKYYYRYMDDMVIFGSSKMELKKLKKELEEKLTAKKLKLKSNWQIFPVNKRGVDFVGYRFFRNYILLRKSIAVKFKRKMNYFSRFKKLTEEQANHIVKVVASYSGWLGHCDGYRLKYKYVGKLNKND